MTTNNHTAISDGAPANASTFRAPMGELDAAIGNLAAFSETSLSAIIDAVIDADGTIKAGAVDGTDALASDVVPSDNLATDPYNQRYAPVVANTMQDGRRRWYASATTATRVATSAAPGGYVTRIPSSESNGRRFHMDEVGLIAGDVVSLRIRALIPTGRSVRAALAWRNSAGTSLGTATGNSTAGAGTIVNLIIENQTIPAATTTVDLYVLDVSGTGDVDVHIWSIVRGSKAHVTQGSGRSAIANKNDGMNLAFDPQNELLGVSESPDDRLRWYNPQVFTEVAAVVGTGLSTPVLHISGTTGGGRRFWLDEMGLKIGDVISIGFMANVTSGKTFLVAMSFIDASNGVLSSVTQSQTGTGVTQIYAYAAATIPASTVSIYVYPSTIAADTEFDIYAWYVVKGPTLGEHTAIRGGVDGEMVLKTAGKFPAERLAYGRGYLRDWFGQIAKIRAADGTSQAVLAMMGDSWTHLDSRITAWVRAWMHAQYGDGGPGWISANDDVYLLTESSVVSRAVAGTWTNRTPSTTPKGYGPDLYDAYTTDTATPAKVTWTTTTAATDFDIHYVKEPNGLGLEYQVDSGGWSAAVDTNAAEAHGVVSITGLSNATHVVEVRAAAAVTGTGAGGLTVLGVDCKRTGVNAVRVHKLGANGTQVSHWNAHPSAAILQATLAQMGVNLCTVTLGTNDHGNDILPTTFATGLDTLIATLRTGATLDVLLLTPADNGNTESYQVQQYMSAQRAVAVRNNCAAFNSYLFLGDYATANGRGLYSDSSHVNALGGRNIAHGLIGELLSDRG